MKPVLLYDIESRLSRARVAQWRTATRQEVEYIPYTDSWGTFPQEWGRPPAPSNDSLFHFIDGNGTVFSGGSVPAQIYRHSPDQRWRSRVYDSVPLVRSLCDRSYDWMAHHRDGAERLHLVLSGRDEDAATYSASRWLFFRILGIVFACAFGSLWWQVIGLNGSGGIDPVAPLISAAREELAAGGYTHPLQQVLRFPTVFLFTGASDAMLNTVALAGLAAGILLTVGILPQLSVAVAWALYLSFITVNRNFLPLQWDVLLVEVGFLALFFVPWQVLPGPFKKSQPSGAVLFLLRLLLFRLVFMSGLVKLGDSAWRNSTALLYHFYTQPLPTVPGWYAGHLPSTALRWMTWSTLLIELVLPILIFAPRRIRACYGLVLVAFQLAIAFTGNFGFFNVLTLGLCVLLFDDAHLKSLLTSATFRRIAPMPVLPAQPVIKRVLCAALVIMLLPLAADSFLRSLGAGIPGMRSVAAAAAPFHLTNSYGLFGDMTISRPEIIIEGSNDGLEWVPYEFSWKPGDVKRAPGWCQPHMPRLDWQMWFEALRPAQGLPPSSWFESFLLRLKAGDKSVTGLLDTVPPAFETAGPNYLRAELYLYEFAPLEARRTTGTWWVRSRIGSYTVVGGVQRIDGNEKSGQDFRGRIEFN